jgi:xylulokinase
MSEVFKSLLLGIDLGTSSCKVTFFDYSGNLIAQTSESYSISYSGLWVTVYVDEKEYWPGSHIQGEHEQD